jgi:RNA polymerase sigma-70 factor (ECF subfamily)
MDVAYLAFTAGYAPGSGADVLRPEQAADAVRLARVLREVAPDSVELDSLLALMLLQHSRRDARVDELGELVLLPDQDRSRWHTEEISEALDLLTPWAHAPGTPYLLQALIAAEHSIAADAADTDWPRIATHYRELDELTGSPIVRLNRAVAVAEADGPQAGLTLLEGLGLAGHRLPAVRGQLLLRLGRDDEAGEELRRAIELCGNEAERAGLRRILG